MPPPPLHPSPFLTPSPVPFPPRESKVAEHFKELQESKAPLKELKSLKFSSVKEVDVGHGRKALLIYVPPTQLSKYRALQKTLIDELEKKMSSTHQCAAIVANRTMVSSQTWARSKKLNGLRPRNRSLKSVQEALLDDLVFPSEISGKRIKVKAGGDRLITVHLSQKDATLVSDRADILAVIYKALTTKAVSIEFN